MLGLGAIAVFTAVNYWGVKAGALVQKVFTLAKVLGLLLIIGSAFLWSGKAAETSSSGARRVFPQRFWSGDDRMRTGVRRVGATDFRRRERLTTHKRTSSGPWPSVGVWTALYLLANAAYLRVLSIPEIAASDHVGATAAERAMGAAAALWFR